MMEKTMNLKTGPFKLLLFLIFSAINFGAFGQGDLLVYPTRLVFNGTKERVKILNFRNQGQDSARYKLSYIENRMTGNGNLEIIEEPEEGQLFASPYLRFYPRSITLAPGETQTVKIQLTRTSDLGSGEYRSHLYIRAEENIQALEKKDSLGKPENISIELKPIYGISTPHIIRIGETKVTAQLEEIAVNHENQIPVLSMKVLRNGNQSLNGVLEVVHIDSQGTQTFVGKKAVIIYTPIGFQNVTMKLVTLEERKFDSGRFAITLTSREGEKKLLASEILDL